MVCPYYIIHQHYLSSIPPPLNHHHHHTILSCALETINIKITSKLIDICTNNIDESLPRLSAMALRRRLFKETFSNLSLFFYFYKQTEMEREEREQRVGMVVPWSTYLFEEKTADHFFLTGC